MNDTIKKEYLEKRLNDLHILLLGLNAYGTLDLTDLRVIENFLKGAFLEIKFIDMES